MKIDCDFDGGNIEVLVANDPADVTLALRPDNAAEFSQWFFFRVRVTPGTVCGFRIENAAESTYPDGWADYRVCVSYDGESWFRIPTNYSAGELRFRLRAERDLLTFAYFAPYTTERHEALLERVHASPHARVLEVGRSVQGRPMSVVAFGDQSKSLHRVWIVAHQHPGETMAAFCAEGLVDRLLDGGDAAAAALLARAEIYIVPRMNPDGSAIGNHRTNAAGKDLNREWAAPSDEASPEVASVRRAIEERGVDLFLDLHGDESVSYVYAFGSRGVPGHEVRHAALEDAFCAALARVEPELRHEAAHLKDPPGTEGDLGLATSYVAERFDCLSLALEMPFIDNVPRPDPEHGWSPDRSRSIGRSLVEAIHEILGSLR